MTDFVAVELQKYRDLNYWGVRKTNLKNTIKISGIEKPISLFLSLYSIWEFCKNFAPAWTSGAISWHLWTGTICSHKHTSHKWPSKVYKDAVLQQLTKLGCAKNLLRYMLHLPMSLTFFFLCDSPSLKTFLFPDWALTSLLCRSMRQRSKGNGSPRAGEVTALIPLMKHHLVFQQRNTLAYLAVRWDKLNFI